jgi:vitellogenic carboxypeptidase-like protein
VAEDLFIFLEQFFTIFHQFKSHPFWIAAESYGGKYGPSAAYYIHQKIQANQTSINLKGIAIGDGALDPAIQFTDLSNLVYYLAMADQQEREVIRGYERRIRETTQAGEWKLAFEAFDEMMNGDFFPYPTYFTNITGLHDYFNFLSPNYPPNPYPKWLDLPTSRQSLHVGTYPYWDYNSTVERYLIEDWMRPVAPKLPALIENYDCLFYNGQNDVILGGPLTTEVLRRLHWNGAEGFKTAKKKIWHNVSDKTDVSGYVVSFKGLTHVIVRDAGHMVPADQPERAYDMITRFILGQPWN